MQVTLHKYQDPEIFNFGIRDTDNSTIENAFGHIISGPTPDEARAAIGAASNPNLLHNWYFVGGGTSGNFPINQRGQTSYTKNDSYAIDRWYISNGRLTFSENVLTLQNTDSSSSGNCLVQRVENPMLFVGKTLTYSILYKDLSGRIQASAYANHNGVNVMGSSVSTSSGLAAVTFAIAENTDPTEFRVHFLLSPSGSCTPIAAKLELGSVSTLAHQDSDGNWVLNDPPPDYGAELAKCQRYYENSWFGLDKSSANEMIGSAFAVTAADVRISYKVTKRIRPTVAFYGSGGFDAWRIYSNGAYSDAKSVANTQRGGLQALTVRVTAADDVTLKADSSVQIHGHWEASANL